MEVSVYESIVLLRLGELACSGFQNFFMPPHLWTEFGGKVIGMVLVADLKKVIVVSSVSHIRFSIFLPLFEQNPRGRF